MIEPNMDAYYEKLDLMEERRRDEDYLAELRAEHEDVENTEESET